MIIQFKHCPKCGSRKLMKILYSEPAYSLELMDEMTKGKIKFGGCVIPEDTPE